MHDIISELPFLTGHLGGIGGAAKSFLEDFVVEEVPLYEPAGSGTHVYALLEKKGLSTPDAIARIARALNIARRDIGFAGLKDARAVTRQWISIEHIDEELVSKLELPNMRIVEITRHGNKIKLGHLAGNRFIIKLRKVAMPEQKAAALAEEILQILFQKGVPNYFGYQRFGNRGNTHLLGQAVIKEQHNEFMDMFLGQPRQEDGPAIFKACEFYEEGRFELAHDAWPYNNYEQRMALKVLIKSSGNKKKAFDSVDKRLKSFFISAYQSHLFNQVLAKRMPYIDKLLVGDMAYKHINGACFRVEDAAKEQGRCDDFEISPTGPLVGSRLTRLTGPAGEIENPVIDGIGLSDKEFSLMKRYGAKGGRRPMRFRPKNWKVAAGNDENGAFLELRFELDAGCYATTVLREITKSDFV